MFFSEKIKRKAYRSKGIRPRLSKKETIKTSTKLKYFATATSLGGVESLVEHRKSVEGEKSPTPDNLLRISVGIEHIDDLIADWEQALI